MRSRAAGLAAWTLLTVAPLAYAGYILAKLPDYAGRAVVLWSQSAGLALSVYAAGTGIFGLVYLRRELSERIVRLARSPRAWRAVAYALLVSLAAGLALGDDEDVRKSIVRGGLVGALLLALLAISAGARLDAFWRNRWVRRLDVALFNLTLGVVLLEGGLRVLASFSDSTVFMRYESNNKLERALTPNVVRMGFPFNSRGFYDGEFSTEKAPGTFRVLVLGDSFAAGIVPYPYNAFTVLEDLLAAAPKPPGVERFEVYNLGVSGIDAGDYRYLLLTEGLRYRPDLVLVLFYLGNDFASTAIPGLIDPNYWYVWFVPHRVRAIQAEAVRRGVGLSDVGGEKTSDWDAPYHRDPALEPPSYSVEGYMDIERKWLRFFRARGHTRRESHTFGALEDIFAAARSVPGGRAGLVLAPAEFQVDDEHYAEVLAWHGWSADQYDLAAPGERLAAFCRDQDVPCLDLAPALREAHRSGRVYHLRDMHWNARGNRAAAEAIVPFVLEAAAR